MSFSPGSVEFPFRAFDGNGFVAPKPTFGDTKSRFLGMFDLRRFKKGFVVSEVSSTELYLASNFSTPRWVLARIAYNVLENLSELKDKSVSGNVNVHLWGMTSLALTNNPYTPKRVIEALFKSGYMGSGERSNIARRKRVSKKLLLELCGSPEIWVRSAAVSNPRCPDSGKIIAALLGVYPKTFK